jgi:hypothetical protein
MNVEIGTEPRNSFSGNICFEFRYCAFAVWAFFEREHPIALKYLGNEDQINWGSLERYPRLQPRSGPSLG